MTKVIVFANQKGGVAKTTTAIALAQSLALDGKKVLFFDLDPQENASNTLRLKQDVPNLYDLMIAPDGDTSVFDACLQSVEGCKNITAIRGNIQLSAADLMFNRQGREFIIKERLEAHKSKFDVVIMDTPPALGVLTVNALTSANTVVVPISPDGYSLQGFYQLNENMRLIKKYSNPQLKIGGILVTRYVPNTNAYRAGRERVIQNARSLRQTARSTRYTAKPAQTAERTASTAHKAIKASARTAVKTSQQSVKVAKHTVKTTEKAAIKTAEVSAKLSQKAAQAAVKAAQTAAKAAKAAAAAAKAAAKAIAAIIKWIVAAVKALVAAIAAGGWVAVVIVVIVALIAAVLCLCFGVFFSNDSAGGMPMTDAIVSIDDGFTASIQARIDELTASADAGVVEILFTGDMEDENSSVSNWVDVLGVYSVYATTGENAAEVITVTPENIEKLRKVFYDMNSFSVTMETETAEEIEVDEYGAIVLDEDGEPIVNTTTTLYINVEVTSLDYRDGADIHSFDESQMEMLMEIMRPEYYPLFAELCGQTLGDGGEYGLGFDINPDLPDSEVGAQIVQAAKRYIGRSYASMDYSGLVRTAYRDCGLSSMNGLNSASMAKKCQEMGVLFTDPSQLQSGDIIFFARKDARRGEGYCTDHRRCGNGRCKRWMQIHHVAIYINGEFLIDSTGGNNSVQIRKHWGKNGSEWQWICFGRPTN